MGNKASKSKEQGRRGGLKASSTPSLTMRGRQVSVRHSLRELEDMYYIQGNKEPLEKLVRAWKGLKENPTSSLKGVSFPSGNVLFPTWHRAFLLKLEEALQSVEPGVTLPYWDETSTDSRQTGIPRTLTDATFELDGKVISNPLRSLVLSTRKAPILDETVDSTDEEDDGTHESPLITLPGDDEISKANVALLNKNVTAWLNGFPSQHEAEKENIVNQYKRCLKAPTYTLFSNSTSADAYNSLSHDDHVVSLESAASGVYHCVWPDDHNDHSEHNLDPLWVMHLAFLDYVFWTWQQENGFTSSFTMDPKDVGAIASAQTNMKNSSTRSLVRSMSTKIDSSVLTMNTPLHPFSKNNRVYTSKGVVDIEKQLRYTYSKGSLEAKREVAASIKVPACSRKLIVSGLDLIPQDTPSYLVEVYAEWKGPRGITKERLGCESIVLQSSTTAGRSSRNLGSCVSTSKSQISFPLAVGLDPLEYARSVTIQLHPSNGPSRTGQSGDIKSFLVKVAQSEANRNIYQAQITSQ
mmetsp:Transcript_1597/g.2275  ORF Transcript_1597/g.2275 Transcript_1597/m.2275 type:complete len:523 (+) Transcript_1597:76-1644(+)